MKAGWGMNERRVEKLLGGILGCFTRGLYIAMVSALSPSKRSTRRPRALCDCVCVRVFWKEV